jgi:2-keto-4-pentenoate hydratase/2-oxohepta-3-ene-1,7-dioic acid hydratase in catechol pathway
LPQSIDFAGRKIIPGKIVCVGRNYVAHIEELGNPIPDDMVLFAKPNSAISDTFHSEHGGEALHYEAEICFVIENKALAGVGFGLDLTKRELQSALKQKGLPWERAKSFDGSALFAPFVALPNNIDQLAVELWIDGDLAQRGDVSMMMFKPPTILKEISSCMSLEDGDIIMTGTPAGVGHVNQGSRFEGKIFDTKEMLTNAAWIAI